MSSSPESGKFQMFGWVDPDFCTGCCLCAEAAPNLFGMHEDGFTRMKQGDTLLPAGKAGRREIQPDEQPAMRSVAEECPATPNVIMFEYVPIDTSLTGNETSTP